MARGSANNVTRTRRGTPTKEIEESKSAESNDKKVTTSRRNNSPITKVEKKGNKKTDKIVSANTSKTSSGASKSVDTNTVNEKAVIKETSKKNQKNKISKVVEKAERKRKAESTNEESIEETVDELKSENVEKIITEVPNKKSKIDTANEISSDSKNVTQGLSSRKTRNSKKVEDEDLDSEGMELEVKIDISEKKEQGENLEDNNQSLTLIKSGAIRKTRSAKKVETTLPVDPKAIKVAEEKISKKSMKTDTVDDSSQDSLKSTKVGSTRKTRKTKKSEDNNIVEQKVGESVEVEELNIENLQKISAADENSSDSVKSSNSGSIRKTRGANKVEEVLTSDLVNEDDSSEIKSALIVDNKEIFDADGESSIDSISFIKSGKTKKTRNVKKVEETIVEQKGKKGDDVDTIDQSSQDPLALKSGPTTKTRGAKKSKESNIERKDTKGEEAKQDHNENDVKVDPSEESSQDSVKSTNTCLARKTRKSKKVEENMTHSDAFKPNVKAASVNDNVKLEHKCLELEVCKDQEENIEKMDEHTEDSNVLSQKADKDTEVNEKGMDYNEQVEFEEHKDKIEALNQKGSDNIDLEDMNIQPQKKDKAETDDYNVYPNIDSSYHSSQAKDVIVAVGDCSTENVTLERTSKHVESQSTNLDSDEKEIFADSKDADEKILMEMQVQPEYSKIDENENSLCNLGRKETELCKNTEGNLQSEDKELNSKLISSNINIESNTHIDTSQNDIHLEINDTVVKNSEYISFDTNPEMVNIAVTTLEGSLATEVSKIQSENIKNSLPNESGNTTEKLLNADIDSVGKANTDKRKTITSESSDPPSVKSSGSEIDRSSTGININLGEVLESKELANISTHDEQINIYVKNESASKEASLDSNSDQCEDGTEGKATEDEVDGKVLKDNIVHETSSVCSANIGLMESEVCESKAEEMSAIKSAVEMNSESFSVDNDQHGTTSKMISDTSEKIGNKIETCSYRKEKASIEIVNKESSTTDVTDNDAGKSVLPNVDSAENTSVMMEKTETVADYQDSIKDSPKDRDQDHTISDILFDSEETTIDMEDNSNLTEEASITNVNLDSPTTDIADSGTESSTINESDSIGNGNALSENIKMLAGIQQSANDNSDSKNQENVACNMIDDLGETKIESDECKKNVELESPVIGMADNGQEHSTIDETRSAGSTSSMAEELAETQDLKGNSYANERDQEGSKTVGDCEETAQNIEGCKNKVDEISAKNVESESHLIDMNNSETENSSTPEIDSVEHINLITKEFTESLYTVKNSSDDIVDGDVSKISVSSDLSSSVEGQEKILENNEDMAMSKAVESIGIISDGTNENIPVAKPVIKSNISEILEDVDCGSNNKESHELENCEMGIKPKSPKKKKTSKKGEKSNKDVDMKIVEKDEAGKRMITTYEVSSNVDVIRKGTKRNITDNDDTSVTEVSLALKIKRKRVEEVESCSVTPSTKEIQYNSSTNLPGTSKSIEDSTQGQSLQSSVDILSEPGPSGFKQESKKPSRKRKRTSPESSSQGKENSAAPVRMYLERFVPFLLEGLLKVTYVRPEDPIQYLADWMKENKEAAYSSMNDSVSSD